MPKQVIDREKLVAQAYAIASRDGVSALSVRKVAAACGIAVGSVYGYFPTKADLTAAVLTRFFDENLSDELCAVRPGERFTSYVRRFREALCAARVGMSVDWFAEMCRLPSGEREVLEVVRAPMLAHIERGLGSVLDADEAVDRSRLVGPMSAEALCRYVLRSIFASLMEGDECETLFALLDAALYDDNADEKDTMK
ncbi:TetR/AcrR family transcriptional regulator [uncultured Actinomyces sp.]|uniref:TetR/AcrR family transcriptional regulator n=1 Tax=uncultured Actinomyces sp. TaxID=249061 RepID=UPI0028E7AFF7|nr:TetR/AcrR family transcriptional regulator [uncultured Actinomyces sp.]